MAERLSFTAGSDVFGDGVPRCILFSPESGRLLLLDARRRVFFVVKVGEGVNF